MDVSMKWLKEFVDIDVNPRDFSEDLTISGTKVEGYIDERELIKNVVVGKVLQINKHPDADKLLVCMMDIGTGEATQIVTGADNLKEGDMVAAALHKSKLPNGTKITKGKLRGVESNGMLCSLSELNLSLNDFPTAEENGILVIEESCAPGDDAAVVLHIDDLIVEFEITPNRPDCLSMIGIAREVAATYKKPLKLHEPQIKTAGENINDYLKSVKITSPVCRKYAAAVLKNVKIEPSPLWMRSRLRASGIRPINNIVDITNYVMLEYGQPMHAFDINHVEGREIIVRPAEEGERIILLDKSEHTLGGDTLVIADKEKASAIAGIMGGSYSGIYDDTKTIVFESANFDSVSIRLSSKKIGVRTDSSTRFEKGLDPENCLPALKRACEIAVMIGAGELVEGFISEGESTPPLREVALDANWINKFIGINISKEEMQAMLIPLGFECKNEKIIVPSFRGDVTIPPDLAEEVARMYGYNKIPATIIHGVASGGRSEYQIFTKKVSDTLVALGGYEIKTFSFISPSFYDNFLIEENHPSRNFVKISNPLGEDTSLMRTLALPSMMQALSKNFNNRNTDVSLFELATTYHPSGEPLPLERDELVIGIYGEEADFYLIKGICERLLGELYIENLSYERYSQGEQNLHPGRAAMVKSSEQSLGYFGQIHPLVSKKYGVNMPCFVASFDMATLFASINKSLFYKPLPKFPYISRDLALIAEQSVPASDIENIIKKAAGPILESVKPFDVYHGSGITSGMKSIAFNLSFRSPDHTLKDIEVEETVAKILMALKSENVFLRF